MSTASRSNLHLTVQPVCDDQYILYMSPQVHIYSTQPSYVYTIPSENMYTDAVGRSTREVPVVGVVVVVVVE